MRRILLYLPLWLSACSLQATEANRQVVSLNGQWEVAEGGMEAIPTRFDRRVPVPGLIDMAEPPFKAVGRKSDRRQAFWYRRRFSAPGPLPEQEGEYSLVAEVTTEGKVLTSSRRQFRVRADSSD